MVESRQVEAKYVATEQSTNNLPQPSKQQD